MLLVASLIAYGMGYKFPWWLWLLLMFDFISHQHQHTSMLKHVLGY